MSRPRIHQLVAGFAEGDAISGEARLLRGLFRGWGCESEIYADRRHVSPDAADDCRSLEDYGAAAHDIVVYHYAIDSVAARCFEESPARKVLIYHNITPSCFYRGFDDRVVAQLDRARAGLVAMLPMADAVWADSEFNVSELRDLGAADARVLPLLFSPSQFEQSPDPNVLEKLVVPMTNILCVGRIAPNKCIEELITAFAWYHRTINRQSRLVIVGSERSCPRYYLMLRMLANELELPNVCFERFASVRGLAAYYQLADICVSTSRHEGYCLPLVEAMHSGVPVIARKAGGMPEALGGAGVMFDALEPAELAVLIDEVLTDAGLRERVMASQRRRMTAVRARDADAEVRALLAPFLG